MKNITEQFKEFRSTTPKHIQWILLGAALLIVVILLTLLIGHKSNNGEKLSNINQQVSFKIAPQTITFTDVVVGKSANQNIKINVNTPVVIDKFDIPDSSFTQRNNCDDLTDSCMVSVIYKPTRATPESKTKMILTWHAANQEDIANMDEVEIIYNAKEAVKPVEPVVVEKPKPKPQPEIYEEDEDDVVAEPVAPKQPAFVSKPVETVAKDIEKIAPVDVFAKEPVDEFVLPPEKCSDFAIPGYNPSGVQIGWIKPERGANYFHPFSDKDCSNPTGKYDFATGIITSLKDGSKIGTDADHIGYRNVRSRNLSMPKLSSAKNSGSAANGEFGADAIWGSGVESSDFKQKWFGDDTDAELLMGSATEAESVTSSRPYDRTFILRQFKPIPATIVSEVRADPSVYGYTGNTYDSLQDSSIPVRATVDRNVFSDDGRTIIIPTGTLLMGYLVGNLPGPYQSVGRMNIRWYQFIRPDGVEFNFGEGQDPYSADAQGRVGVPGHGSTDYVEQMVMPILTSIVPAAVNMIAPIADTIVNQIDLDNNTIVQSGTVRSSEMAKQEIISTWNKVAQKLLVDALDNTTPPFSIAAGTRINVYSPVDLIVSCESPENKGKKCAVIPAGDAKRRSWNTLRNKVKVNKEDSSWVGQVRSFDYANYCSKDSNGKWTVDMTKWKNSNQDYRALQVYCESLNYEAKNNAKQAAYYDSQTQKFTDTYGTAGNRTEEQTKAYNTEVLGLKYDDDGYIENPFNKSADSVLEAESEVLTCLDGSDPDMYGCCAGETYTDMGDAGFNCCPDDGGDCFPPIEK